MFSKSYFTFKFIIYYNFSYINWDLPNVTKSVPFADKTYFAHSGLYLRTFADLRLS